MGVGVPLIGFTVRSPTGMADAYLTPKWGTGQHPFQIRKLANIAAKGDFSVLFDDGHT
jgi:hypothetical protein